MKLTLGLRKLREDLLRQNDGLNRVCGSERKWRVGVRVKVRGKERVSEWKDKKIKVKVKLKNK